ncbi:NAD(P)-dependent oxidoreductase [Rubrivirga sp.]|uniref:NAD(P)-dependent oxidoreductase n=1 Tax=Rubrivirga sp. TaxID=1885344 RepID=UPI003C707840
MRIALFGGTGRTGRPFLDQALQAGHDVVASVRTPSKLGGLSHDRLTVLEGDVLDAAHVASVLEGADAVVLTLGPTKGGPKSMMTRAAQNVISAMKRHGVQRVVTETGAGVGDPKDPGGFGPKLMSTIMGLVAKDLLTDSVGHVDAFRDSGLEWTAVRAPRLTEGAQTGDVKVGYFSMGPGHSVSRADVAAVMLRLATSDEYAGQAPHVTGA